MPNGVRDGENGGQYILDGENARMLAFVQEIAGLLGNPFPPAKLPSFLVKAVAAVSNFFSTMIGREPSVTYEIATQPTGQAAAYWAAAKPTFASAASGRLLAKRKPLPSAVLDRRP